MHQPGGYSASMYRLPSVHGAAERIDFEEGEGRSGSFYEPSQSDALLEKATLLDFIPGPAMVAESYSFRECALGVYPPGMVRKEMAIRFHALMAATARVRSASSLSEKCGLTA